MQDWKFYNVKILCGRGLCGGRKGKGGVQNQRVGVRERRQETSHFLSYGPKCRFEMKAVARKETQERGEEKAVGVVNG